jgi:hypothetical protein
MHLSVRNKVERVVDMISQDGRGFWGVNQLYSRRRTVIDSAINMYYDALEEHLAAKSLL